jgi:hypothetical protein
VLCSIDEPISIQDKADSDIDLFVIEDGKQTVTEIPEGLSANEWDDIQVRLQESRYYPTWSQTAQGYVASNPRHQWRITYDEGVVLVNPSSGKDWSWLLTPAGYGYRGNIVPMNDDPEVVVNENSIEFVYNKDLTGWYVNDEKGLEHGFTINAPPQPITTRNLLFEMSLQTSLTSKTINEEENIAFLDDSGKVVLNYGKLIVTDAYGHIIPSALCIFSDSITISVNDTNAVYPLEIDPILITEIKKLTASDGAAGDNFGQSVSISGDTVVVGARFDDVGANDNQGSAYIFERNQGGLDNWGMVVKLTSSDGEAGDHFGEAVYFSGDTIAVGAPYEDSGVTYSQGAVYIFDRNQGGPNNWGEITKILASDGFNEDYFGAAVSIDGDTLVVGAHRDDIGGQVDQGSAYIFERNQGGSDNWGEVTKLTTLDGLGNDLFGNSVSICNDTVAIGVHGDDIGTEMNQGSVCIFERNLGGPDNWGLVKKITASDGLTIDYFGSSVSIHNDTLVVGAWWDDLEGSAYIFERDEGGIDNWGVVTKLSPIYDDHLAHFGGSASINRDTIIIGASVDDIDENEDQGSVYIYYRNQGGNNNWGMVDMITSSDGEAGDYFGFSVSIMGDTFIIGANRDNITGEDEQGSAYIFNLSLPNNIPTITTPDNTTAYEDSQYSTDYDADDLDGDPLIWSLWTDADAWLSIDSFSGNLSGTPDNNHVGTWIVNVSVSDGNNGIDFSNFTLTVVNTNDAPIITTSNVNIANEDELYIIDYEATDEDQDPLSWSLDTNASWLYIAYEPGVLSGTPQNSDVGSWTVNVSVSDGKGGTDFSNFTLTVLNTNDAPQITTSNVNSANVDELYSVDYEATDDDLSDTLSWDLDTNASWLYIDISSGILSGIPDESDVGSYWVNVSVSDDNGGSGFTEFTLTVLNPNNAPIIITDDIDSVLEGELYSVDYDATDDDQDILSWTLNTNASWLGIDSSSGVLSGTPDGNDVGSYSVKVTVSDGKGGSDETEYTLEVLADSDGDGIPDSDDTDNDNDGYMDNNDAFPDDPDEWLDTDGDGIGNNADSDDDNDGYDDDEDDLPLDDTEWQDTDNDGIGNIADDDDDDDGYDDEEDDFPLDDTEWLDTDSDGIGNNEDSDDDEDGVLDINDRYPLDPTRSKDAEEQESMYMYVLLILIIIIALILILVSFQKNKKIKAGETSVAPLPTQPAIQSGTQNLRCPHCQNLFEAPLASTTIQCPHCGYSANVQ